MADISLKSVAANCLSLSPPFSAAEDVFGYIFGTPAREISLKQHLEAIQGPSLDVNVIIVGPETFSGTDFANIQYAIQFARDSYAKVGLGIRKLDWLQISQADAGDYLTINSRAEAVDLTDDWNGPEGALDLFVVRVMTYAEGSSQTHGPCEKDSKDEMTGSVVSLNCPDALPDGVTCGDANGTTFAHEMGHYLGLEHVGSEGNLMKSPGAPSQSSLSALQGTLMKVHCYVGDKC